VDRRLINTIINKEDKHMKWYKLYKEGKRVSIHEWVEKLEKLGYDIDERGDGQYRSFIISLNPYVVKYIYSQIKNLNSDRWPGFKGRTSHLNPESWTYLAGGYTGSPRKDLQEFLNPPKELSGYGNGYARIFNRVFEDFGFHMTNDFEIEELPD
jgi:hypothetical protein